MSKSVKSVIMTPEQLYDLFEDDRYKRFYRKARQTLEEGGVSRYHRARLFGLLAMACIYEKLANLDEARRYQQLYQHHYRLLNEDPEMKEDKEAFDELRDADAGETVSHVVFDEFCDVQQADGSGYDYEKHACVSNEQMLNGHDDQLVKSEMAEIMGIWAAMSKSTMSKGIRKRNVRESDASTR